MVALGEVLWDVFPTGKQLGGAPANFAVHCAALGACVHLVSAVGEDALGVEAKQALVNRRVDTSCVAVSAFPTGTVPVTVTDGQPTYDIVTDVAWDSIDWQENFEALARRANAICFGTLGQRSQKSRETIQRFLDTAKQNCLRVLDVNFRQDYHNLKVLQQSLALANMLKLSDEEITLFRTYVEGDDDPERYLEDLRQRFQLAAVVVTMGARGCRVYTKGGVVGVGGSPQDVVNTVGAGDAFTAGFVCQYLNGASVQDCAELANQVGGFVTTQEGATPQLPEHFCVWRSHANR